MPVTPASITASAHEAIREQGIVRLRNAIQKEGLKAGVKGAVVHVYEGGEAFDVEFLEGISRPCLVILTEGDVEGI